MNNITVISMPLWQLPVIVTMPLMVFGCLLTGLRRISRFQSGQKEKPDWSVPQLETTTGVSPLHQWDVRCKIVTILGYSFLISALRQMVPALIALGLSCLILALARVSFFKVLMRLMAVAGFITMFLVVMPFTVTVHSGDTVIVFGELTFLKLNIRGLILAMTIAVRVVAITLLMEPLLSTASLPQTLQGLSSLGVPEIVAQMVLLSYRYLNVFRHEALRMSDGMRVRGFHKRSDSATIKAMANFLGMLFVRSYERTQRVFDAMRARGYNGQFPEHAQLHLRTRDLVFSFVWLSTGVILVVFDRMI